MISQLKTFYRTTLYCVIAVSLTFNVLFLNGVITATDFDGYDYMLSEAQKEAKGK